ncbi:MAG: type II toxin-antitoxin system VapC family toxin [Armatimonadetes bacterium]|nr:type II toxin-antitoxin system VapC family toxin [Armatimonadota bacterium]
MGQEAKEVVVNASVFLAAILLDEPVEVSKPAFLLLLDIMKGKLVVHVPDRFEDEVLGGLVEAFTRGRPMLASPEGVFRILQRFLTKVIVHHRDWDWNAQEVFNASLRWQVSYYDAIYLLIAQKIGATYWTADKKLLRFLQRQKFTDLPRLDWIGSYR